jgi:hypothetical protein
MYKQMYQTTVEEEKSFKKKKKEKNASSMHIQNIHKSRKSLEYSKKRITSITLYTLKTMDFFLRFADDIKILVDAKAICFLRLCKNSAGILLRLSLKLSKYKCTMVYVPGENNGVSGVLSTHHEGLDKLVKESKTTTPMTEIQKIYLLK